MPQSLEATASPQRPAPRRAADLLPLLRAYGGLRVAQETAPAPVTLGRLGTLEARLAVTASDVRRAQRLRYEVFYGEGTARADAAAVLARRDMDPFDSICDHLLVLDHSVMEQRLGKPPRPLVVGTYRLLRGEVAARHGGFYTQGEFDIAGLMRRHAGLRFLELGRSCVRKPWRTKRSVELLWHGIWAYVLRHRLDVMLGCASLEGTDPERLALPLSFLHHFAPAPEPWRAGAHGHLRVEMNRMPREQVDPRQALGLLPPLIKGYLRLGAHVGDGAVVDHQFGTTDVLIVMPVAGISERHVRHFGVDAGRHSA
jgi:putative hemolysin